ncbi:MAG TPA: transposase [Streptosporangiaceae bacterium]
MIETVRYTYRLRPGAVAGRVLVAEWHRCRWLWNEAVHQQKTGNKPTFCTLSKLLTEARARHAWLREGSQVAQQQALRAYAQALDHSFKVKVRGKPRARQRRTALPTLECTTRGFCVRDGRLILPKGVSIPVVWSRELPSPPTSVRVYRDNLGHWYASFVVTRNVAPAGQASGGIGVDWGVRTPATTTDPAFDFPHLGHRKRCAAEVAGAQRKMARRARRRGRKLHGPRSGGYRQAERQNARAQKRAARQNQHDGRMWARNVVASHDLIAVEDFRPTFLARSTMARKAADNTVGTLKRTLIEYGTRAGRKVVLVQPAYTTMTCSECGERQARLGLAERTFTCAVCGYTADRDVNAARVVLAVAERGHVSAEDASHWRPPPPPGGSPARSELEIPRLSAVRNR